MYEFRYSTEHCPDASMFKMAHTMMYVMVAAMIAIPILGFILVVGVTQLFDVPVSISIGLGLASLVVTLPIVGVIASLAKTNTAIVYEATYGRRAAWDR